MAMITKYVNYMLELSYVAN